MIQTRGRLSAAAFVLGCMAGTLAILTGRPALSLARNAHVAATSTPPPQAAVLNLGLISADRAAHVLHALFPRAHLRVDPHANAVLVVASLDEIAQMRTVVQGIDVRSPESPTVEIVQVHVLKPKALALRIAGLYPRAHVEIASKQSILIRALPADQTEIRALITALDVAPATPPPTPETEDSVRVTFATPHVVARALARQMAQDRKSVV